MTTQKDRDMKSKAISIIIAFFVILIIIGIGIFVLIRLNNSPEFFKELCIDQGGEYYELQNASCQIGYKNCILNCRIDGEVINFYDKDKLMERITDIG